jgi:hypothetical protein
MPERPPQFDLSEADFRRIVEFLEASKTEREPNERLLAEILECLRSIESKLDDALGNLRLR